MGQALDQVIDRELLVQQALKDRLDADPQVARAIEEARRQVLAQAWLERAARRAGSGSQEVSAFYAENPALFAQRRIYRFRELGVTGTGEPGPLIEQVRAELTGARDLDEVAGWLKWRNLKVGPVTGATQPAEQLPLNYLPQLARMRDGEIAVFPTAFGASVVQLVQAQDAPLSEQDAAPLIEKFLSGRRKLELAMAEAKRLRAAAKIEYVGDFKR
jgi:EpsD family peptidyl-prolyl cis-trans isomerase